MLEKDAQLIRLSMAQEHFTSPLSDKQFGITDLERREQTLKMIERKFRGSVEETPEQRLKNLERQRQSEAAATKKIVQSNNRSVVGSQYQSSVTKPKKIAQKRGSVEEVPSKPITFPLVMGDDYLDDLLKEMRQEAVAETDIDQAIEVASRAGDNLTETQSQKPNSMRNGGKQSGDIKNASGTVGKGVNKKGSNSHLSGGAGGRNSESKKSLGLKKKQDEEM